MSRKIEDKNKGKKNNNSGFTLIEMVVTVAIIAIFAGVILTLITNGSNSYRNTSNNAKVQIDTQELLDEIEDLIIDTNRSVYYFRGASADIDTAQPITSDIGDNNSVTKTFLVCNEYENGDGTSQYIVDVLEWVASEEKIYYSRKPYNGVSSSVIAAAEEEAAESNRAEFSSVDSHGEEEAFGNSETDGVKNVSQPLELVADIGRSVYAEGVVNFNADVTKVENERLVRFELTTDSGGKEIETIYTVNLRNKIQVQKPSDAFSKAPSQNLFIEIRNNPISMEAGGEPVRLRYEVGPRVIPGELDIDPSTVRWTVVSGPGSFPQEDPTSGKLTADANGSGTITVKVSAVTIKGVPIESSPVDILVINKKQPSDLEPSTGAVLIGAGNSADLNDLVSWKQKYDDGSVGEDDVKVNWSTDCGFAEVTEDGKITIEAKAGTETTGSFTVTGINPETGSKGTVTVKVARIDLIRPAGVYHVGDEKPLEYVYREAGQKVDSVEPIIVATNKSGKTEPYKKADLFIENDIGEWEISASLDLAERSGYGKVVDKVEFTVEDFLYDGEIVLGADAIVAGNTYSCSETHDYGFRFKKNWTDTKHRLVWSIKHETSSGTTITSNSGNDEATIIIGENERGFILRAEYIQYKSEDSDEIVKTIIVEKPVDVAYKVEIVTLPAEVKIGETYDLGIEVTIGSISLGPNGPNYSDRIINAKNGDNDTIIHWDGTFNDGGINENKNKWTVSSNYQNNTILTANVRLQKIPEIFLGTHSNYLYHQVNLKVVEPVVNLEIVGADNGFINEPIELWLRAEVDGEIIDIFDVNWSNNTKPQKSTSNSNSKVKFIGTWEGKHEITASISCAGKTYSKKKEIQLKKHQVSAEIREIKGRTSILVGDTLEFNIDARVDGKFTDDYSVTWQCYGFTGENSADNKIMRYETNQTGNYSFQAVVSIGGEQKYLTYNFTVTELSIRITKGETVFYPGNPNCKYEVKVWQEDKEVTRNYPVTWEYQWVDSTKTCGITLSSDGILSVPSEINTDCSMILTAYLQSYPNIKATKNVYFYPKKTMKPKTYYITPNEEIQLGIDEEDKNKEYLTSITVQYVSGLTENIDINNVNIPALSIDFDKLSVAAKAESLELLKIESLKITMDMYDTIYIHTIIPSIYNIYSRSGTIEGYALSSEDSITANANLDTEGFTYVWENLGHTYEFRNSISMRTGVGTFNGLFGNSSMHKWFMKYNGKYYKLQESDGTWREFIEKDTLGRYIDKYWLTGRQTIWLLGGDCYKEDFWYDWRT